MDQFMPIIWPTLGLLYKKVLFGIQSKELEPFVKAMYRKLEPFVKVPNYQVLNSSKTASPGPIYLI